MKKIIPLIALLGIVFAAWWLYSSYIFVAPLPEGLIQANGRIEGDIVMVSSKYPGRISSISVNEGDEVSAGDALVQFDDKTVNAKVRQAEQALSAVDHEVKAAQSLCEQAQRDAERFRELYTDGTATKRETEQADLAEQVATEKQIASEAQLKRAEAEYDEACIVRDDLTLVAPSNGIITNRLHEPGAIIAAGSPVLTLVDLDGLHLKVYVPEDQLGKLKLGLPAKVYTDAFPNTPYDATVGYIASRAEFTPKEVQTLDERVKLVYAVKLMLDANPERRLTPGIPADAVIRWDPSVDWSAPQW